MDGLPFIRKWLFFYMISYTSGCFKVWKRAPSAKAPELPIRPEEAGEQGPSHWTGGPKSAILNLPLERKRPMAERLAEDLWRLDIPLVGNPLKNLNSYLLTGERSLLIDTGFRQQSCREAMERQLAETHVDRDRLDIFCTHLHSDHTGLAPELIRPGCRIYIGEIDSPGVKNASDPSCWKRLYGGICAGRLHPGGDGGPVGRQSGPDGGPALAGRTLYGAAGRRGAPLRRPYAAVRADAGPHAGAPVPV